MGLIIFLPKGVFSEDFEQLTPLISSFTGVCDVIYGIQIG